MGDVISEIDFTNQLDGALTLNTVPYDENIALEFTASDFGSGSVRLNKYQKYADSDWGEIVCVEDASEANTDKIEGYLAHKWGLTGDLPVDHPYEALLHKQDFVSRPAMPLIQAHFSEKV